MRARTTLTVVLAVLLTATAPIAVAGSPVPGSASTANLSRTAVADETGNTVDVGTIRERVTLRRVPEERGTVEVELAYDVPSSVTDLEVDSPFIGYRDVSVVSSDGFDRRSEQGFVWEGVVDEPTITLRLDVALDSFDQSDVGVETDEWAFAYLPDPYVNWRYRGEAPDFTSRHVVATEGYATGSFGLVGAGSIRTQRVADVNLTTVVAPDARLESSGADLADIYRVGGREIVGYSYPNSSVFVLPTPVFARRSPIGTTVVYDMWLQSNYSSVETVESTPAHEYVHTRMGTFERRTGRWLTEASAEYYGALLSMNTDNGDWESFRASMAVDREPIAESTLSRPRSWSSGFVPYEKGSRVLAALDAEIRSRTDGRKTLQDVLAYRFEDGDPHGDLNTYGAFADAVVAVTGDPEMREWLDRYVRGEDVPPLPSDPGRFVLNETMDSDGDGVDNGAEVATNPFDADTDDDGVDDGEDAYPTDAARSEAGDAPVTTATTATSASTTSSTTADAGASTDSSTPTTRKPAGTSDSVVATTDATPSTTGSAGSTGSSSDEETTAEEDEPDADIPGFGSLNALVAVTAMLVLAVRRRGS